MDELEHFPDIIQLNVGGMMVATHLSTLVKDENSMLAAMFSGRHVVSKDEDGRYFIDADGDVFKHILEFLRFGKIPSKDQALNVYHYAEYFGITDLIKALGLFPEIRTFLRKRSYDEDLNLDKRLYEKLKLDAIKEIDMIYNKESTLLTVNIKKPVEDGCNGNKCQPIMYSDPKSGNSKALATRAVIHTVVLYVSSETGTGWSKRLAYDLRELGFFKYTYYLESEEILRCKRCNKLVGRTETILLENSLSSEFGRSCWKKP